MRAKGVRDPLLSLFKCVPRQIDSTGLEKERGVTWVPFSIHIGPLRCQENKLKIEVSAGEGF